SPSSRLTEHFSDKFKLKLAGILTGTKMRSSPRGRSAFLTLSDSHGQYEVAVFDEYLLNQHHALLKNGVALMLGIDVRHSERGQRLLVTRIDPLDDVSQSVRASTLTVKVDDVNELQKLKAMLGAPTERGAKVELHVSIPSGVVKLALPGNYSIATNEIMQVQTLQGVTAEAA
ncbi:MAG: hypothetical protein K2X09_04535, partial [Rickettsiales bacterium]|nr:hypothetical protein [Rickettsiales bacterium]